MRVLISFLAVVILAGCKCDCKKKQAAQLLPTLKIEDGRIREFVLNTGPDDTDHTFSYDFVLPNGFYHDSISLTDSATGFYGNAWIIVSDEPGFEGYSTSLKKFLKQYLAHNRSFIDETGIKNNPFYSYDVEVGPHQLYINEYVISMCFMVDAYATGGAHHNYEFLTFNYDLKNNRQIRFSEVFPMKTKKDTLALVNHLNWKIEYDHLPEQYDSLDFAFTKQGVCFHTQWHMKQALLDADSINNHVNKWYAR